LDKAPCQINVRTVESQRLRATHSAKNLDRNERQNIIARGVQKVLAFFRGQNPGRLGRDTHFVDRIEGIHHRIRALDREAEQG
jgi:hypothetical protein